MAKALTANVTQKVDWTHVNTVTAGTKVRDADSDLFTLALTNGTGSNGTADLKFNEIYTLTASGTQDIDLAGGIADAFGTTFSFVRVKIMQIRQIPSSEDAASLGGPVDVGGKGGTSFVNWIDTTTAKVRLGGTAARAACLTLSCDDAVAYGVGAGATDILTLTETGGASSVKVEVTFIGASA